MNRSLDQVLRDRTNALTLVRVALAVVVVLAHSAPLSGLGPHPMVGGVGLGGWAVYGFFAISGYVVAQSRSRLALREFVVHRALRILPGFWVVNIFTAIVAAPLAAALAASTVDVGSAASYVFRNAGLSIRQWGISDTLADVPHQVAWNGSLWTLSYEAGWYVFIAVLFLSARMKANLPAVSLLCLALLSSMNAVADSWVCTFGAFFLSGMVLYSVREWIRVSPALIAGAVAVVVGAAVFDLVEVVAPLALAYVLLSCAALPAPQSLLGTDPSYGIYIYAFPVQQVLAQAGAQRLGLAAFALLSLVVTVPLAWLSWWFIESPALRLRRKAGHTRTGPREREQVVRVSVPVQPG